MSEDLSQRLGYPYTLGMFLAVNAVPDAYLVMDGPGCCFYRAMTVHGRHDWASSLLSATGHHRVQYAGVNANTIASDYEGMLREVVAGTCALEHPGAVLLGSMPICTIAGTQHDRILREERGNKPAAVVPGRSLSGDWFDGYDSVMSALASAMDLGGARPGKDKAAVVGYFMDRCEGEHRGNVAELKRLLGALGLDCVSVWLSGEPFSGLREVRKAGTIISLPHGRKTAAALARRLRARLVETELPFGLDETRAWLLRVAAATGRRKRAERLIDTELSRLVPRLEWVVPSVFLGRTVFFAGDPHLWRGLRATASELGMKVSGACLTGRRKDAEGASCAPRMSELRGAFERLRAEGAPDLLVGNADVLSMLRPDCGWMELGYPSVWTHRLKDEPYLGFEGALSFMDHMADALTQKKASPSEKAA